MNDNRTHSKDVPSKTISDQVAYDRLFPSRLVKEKALETALDIRKFEIQLYWTRTAYFWTLIAAIFVGYFDFNGTGTNRSAASHPDLVFLITCIGLIISLSWYLVNRGSKYWQENWEKHVDELEDEFIGPLYKMILSEDLFPFLRLTKGYPFSVSRVNQIVSLYVTLIWCGLFADSLQKRVRPLPSAHLTKHVILDDPAWLLLTLATVIFGFCLVFFSRTKRNKKWWWQRQWFCVAKRATFDKRTRTLVLNYYPSDCLSDIGYFGLEQRKD